MEPRSMARAGDRLVVGDPTRVRLVPLAGSEAKSVGREGEGPGEYTWIASVGRGRADTVVVYDGPRHRLNYLSPEGALLGSARVTPHSEFPNVAIEGARLQSWNRGYLWTARAVLSAGQPLVYGLVWFDPAADTTAVLYAWQGEVVGNFDGIFSRRDPLGPTTVVTVGPERRVASGTGVEYCIDLRRLGRDGITRLCRDRPRTPIGPAIASPDPDLLEGQPRGQRLLRAMTREVDPPARLPSFDRIRFADDGGLWVRTLGPEVADFHPIVRDFRPEPGPTHRFWDVFDASDRLTRTVRLPSRFDPRIVSAETVFGILELPTGEPVLAVADLASGEEPQTSQEPDSIG